MRRLWMFPVDTQQGLPMRSIRVILITVQRGIPAATTPVRPAATLCRPLSPSPPSAGNKLEVRRISGGWSENAGRAADTRCAARRRSPSTGPRQEPLARRWSADARGRHRIHGAVGVLDALAPTTQDRWGHRGIRPAGAAVCGTIGSDDGPFSKTRAPRWAAAASIGSTCRCQR